MTTFTFKDVKNPSATFTNLAGINNDGTIVGRADNDSFELINGTFTTITGPQGVAAGVNSINDQGGFAGDYVDNNTGTGFSYNGTSYTTLSVPGSTSTVAEGINDAGQVVGIYSDNAGLHAFFYNGSFRTLVGDFGFGDLQANGINNTGLVAGIRGNSGTDTSFIYDVANRNYTAPSISDPFGTMGTDAKGINNEGQVVGFYTDSNGVAHGFLYSGGTYTTIDDPSGTDTILSGINDAGQIVGWYTDATSHQVGFAVTVSNPTAPGTTAVMVMSDGFHGDLELYDIGNNTVLGANGIGEVGFEWNYVGLGSFRSGDTDDLLMRNTSTGAFETYYIGNSNSSITGAAAVGTVGVDWNFAGIGDFDGASSLSEMLLRNAASGSFELYQVAGGGVLSGSSVAAVGNNFQVKGFGNFSEPNTTQMMMQDNSGDASNGQLELYTYQPSTASFSGINVGKVGSNLSIVGCADLLGNGSTQMVMEQNNGNYWLYTYSASTNSLSGLLVGAIGSNFHVVGFGSLGTSGQDEMLMQDAAGDFEVYQYNASINAFSGQSMGTVGAPWTVDGIAGVSAGGGSTAQLTQAMASFGTTTASTSTPALALGAAEQSPQALLTAPPHG